MRIYLGSLPILKDVYDRFNNIVSCKWVNKSQVNWLKKMGIRRPLI